MATVKEIVGEVQKEIISIGKDKTVADAVSRLVEDEIEAAIAAHTSSRDAWELAEALQQAGVPASAVEDVGDLVGRDRMRDGFLEETDHPAGHSMLLQHEPVTWNGERLPINRAPLLGEHTAAVCAELLGLDTAAVAELVAEGVLY